MARIRTIKPEFPQSESIGRLSRDARLLFVQLWTIVDDAGRTRAASRMLASLLYPYDDDAPKQISKWLAELEHESMIRCYQVDGAQYLYIPKWLEHQKIDRPSASRLPASSEASLKTREPSRALDADLVPVPSTLDPDPSCAVASATRAEGDKAFDEFWKEARSSRGKARNPKHPARLKFFALVKAGTDPAAIVAGWRRYLTDMRAAGKFGAEFVAMAVTWLNQRSFEDYPEISAKDTEPIGWKPGMPTDEELRRQYTELMRDGQQTSTAKPDRVEPGDRELREGSDQGRDGEIPHIRTEGHRKPGVVQLGQLLENKAGLRVSLNGPIAGGQAESGDSADAMAAMVRS